MMEDPKTAEVVQKGLQDEMNSAYQYIALASKRYKTISIIAINIHEILFIHPLSLFFIFSFSYLQHLVRALPL